ncbi:uncharacterized protein LOC144145581 [Haemaphysalis longicornis]
MAVEACRLLYASYNKLEALRKQPPRRDPGLYRHLLVTTMLRKSQSAWKSDDEESGRRSRLDFTGADSADLVPQQLLVANSEDEIAQDPSSSSPQAKAQPLLGAVKCEEETTQPAEVLHGDTSMQSGEAEDSGSLLTIDASDGSFGDQGGAFGETTMQSSGASAGISAFESGGFRGPLQSKEDVERLTDVDPGSYLSSDEEVLIMVDSPPPGQQLPTRRKRPSPLPPAKDAEPAKRSRGPQVEVPLLSEDSLENPNESSAPLPSPAATVGYDDEGKAAYLALKPCSSKLTSANGTSNGAAAQAADRAALPDLYNFEVMKDVVLNFTDMPTTSPLLKDYEEQQL